MRRAFLALLLVACTNTGAADALARGRRACTSEGMWCQDAAHSRCCRGLKCEDSRCVRRESKHKDDGESL